MGIAVTRKTGGAVVRNRVKRVVREFFRLRGSDLLDNMMMQQRTSHGGKNGLDLVVSVRRGIDPALLSLEMAERELTPLLRQLAQPSKTETARP